MDYSKANIPFFDYDTIDKRADEFRKKYNKNRVPIDIEKLIEIDLEIDIIPTENLKSICGTDALIQSSWKSIYVDKKIYTDERYLGRYRFSVAHEMGHLILHKNIYSKLGIESLKDYYNFLENFPSREYDYLEGQAHKFANCLLIPKEALAKERNKLIEETPHYLDGFDERKLIQYIATPLSRKFKVSEQPMEIALSYLAKKENGDF